MDTTIQGSYKAGYRRFSGSLARLLPFRPRRLDPSAMSASWQLSPSIRLQGGHEIPVGT